MQLTEQQRDPDSNHHENGSSRKDVVFCCLLFLIALGIRLFYLNSIEGAVEFNKYPHYAEKLANGVDIHERVLDLSPFYLAFWTVIQEHLSVDRSAVKFFQALLGTINCLLLFAVGKQIANRGAAFIAAYLYACYGNLIVLETSFEPLVFVLLFNLLALLALLHINQEQTSLPKTYFLVFLSAVFTGISVLTKPNFLLFLPIAIAWILLALKDSFSLRERVKISFLFLFTATAVISPVTIRNYMKFDDFVLVTADYGKVFYHGNAKGATVFAPKELPSHRKKQKLGPDGLHVQFRLIASEVAGRELSPSEAARYWVGVTLQDILSDPIRYLSLELQKFRFFFHDYELHFLVGSFREYKRTLGLPLFRYGLISTLAVLGMLFSIRNFRSLLPVYGVVFLYLLSALLLVVNSRYRAPAVPSMCLFAGCFSSYFVEMVKARNIKVISMATLLFVLLFYCNHSSLSGIGSVNGD